MEGNDAMKRRAKQHPVAGFDSPREIIGFLSDSPRENISWGEAGLPGSAIPATTIARELRTRLEQYFIVTYHGGKNTEIKWLCEPEKIDKMILAALAKARR